MKFSLRWGRPPWALAASALVLAVFTTGCASSDRGTTTPSHESDRSSAGNIRSGGAAAEVEALRQLVSELKTENQRLEQSNAALLEMLSRVTGETMDLKRDQRVRQPTARPSPRPEGTEAASEVPEITGGTVTLSPAEAAQQGLTHWLTLKSQIRHNKDCPYFNTTKGRFCAPEEGKPCKLCGG